AELSARGSARPDPTAAGAAARGEYTLRLGGAAAALGAAAGILLGVVLVGEGWRAHQAERQRLTALHLTRRAGRGDDARALACLQRAVQFTPENASLQLELAEAHHRQSLPPERALAACPRVPRAARPAAPAVCPAAA